MHTTCTYSTRMRQTTMELNTPTWPEVRVNNWKCGICSHVGKERKSTSLATQGPLWYSSHFYFVICHTFGMFVEVVFSCSYKVYDCTHVSVRIQHMWLHLNPWLFYIYQHDGLLFLDVLETFMGLWPVTCGPYNFVVTCMMYVFCPNKPFQVIMTKSWRWCVSRCDLTCQNFLWFWISHTP